jgi:hypothetical protein
VKFISCSGYVPVAIPVLAWLSRCVFVYISVQRWEQMSREIVIVMISERRRLMPASEMLGSSRSLGFPLQVTMQERRLSQWGVAGGNSDGKTQRWTLVEQTLSVFSLMRWICAVHGRYFTDAVCQQTSVQTVSRAEWVKVWQLQVTNVFGNLDQDDA